MSIPTDRHYIWCDAKATVRLLFWLCEAPKVPIRSAISYSYPHEDSNSILQKKLTSMGEGSVSPRISVQISSACNVPSVSLTARA
jgi:hypothetical protein